MADKAPRDTIPKTRIRWISRCRTFTVMNVAVCSGKRPENAAPLDSMEYSDMTAKWQRSIFATWFLLTSFFPISFAQTARELMHRATPVQRAASFQTFLKQHGKRCSVDESIFTAKLVYRTVSGDAWSVRCAEGQEYAVFIAADATSTSWFMPCDEVRQRSNLRCFKNYSSAVGLE